MERLTKIIVTLWTCAAIAEQTWLLRSWQNLPWLTLGAAVVALVLGRFDRRTIAPILLVAYMFPALVRLIHGIDYAPFSVLWMGALVGAILPDALLTPWHIPKRWRGALVFAALVVVISSVISIWREVDGAFTLLTESGSSMNWRGLDPPSFPIRWILNISLILVVGVLWFDWLCGADGLDFERTIVTPLVFGATVMAAASAYQMFGDIHFLNEHAFGNIGRASGKMYDSNVAGMLAAIWLGGIALWAWRLRGWRVYAATVGVVLSAIAVWGSGSRTALMVAVTTTLAGILSAALAGPTIKPKRIALGLGLAGAILGLLLAVGAANPDANNPGARVWTTLTSFKTPMGFANEMWNRNGYGAAAAMMIRQFPIVGVGVGSFYAFVTDFLVGPDTRLPPDNAQNWLRHQIAEFGFLGALGWIVWVLAFAAFVLIPRPAEQMGTWILRGILVAFGLMSMLGMPGQELMVAFTFWTIAFWYVSLVGRPAATGSLSKWTWLGIVLTLTAFAVGTSSVAATTLRVPERQRLANRPFSYGYAAPEPAGPNEGYRRVSWRAVALVEPTSRWMAVTVRRENPANDLDVVEVRVRAEGWVLLKAQLRNREAVTGFVPVGPAPKRVLLETTARRQGVVGLWPSTRDRGVLIKWEFVDEAPPQYRHYTTPPTEGQ